jgi:hypothetical protein
MNGYPPNVEHALSNVRAYYDQWRALSEAESSAIRSGQWMHVDRIQESKRNLQQFIAGATQDMRSQCVASGLDLDLVEARLRDVINDLIHMETSNGRALADQMRAAREQQQQLDASSHNLRQVKRVYSSGRDVHWESYS